MLRLLKQLGQDFGKTMLISTHLLADVETVCERVVILYGGQIAGVGTVAELCPPRPGRYRVRVIGDTNSFSSQLQAHKIEILNRSPQGEWVIRGAADLTVNQLIEYAHRSSCTLRAAIPDDETLEETYRRLVASR
jgi:ABC-2 type transport system ATP-binding protein